MCASQYTTPHSIALSAHLRPSRLLVTFVLLMALVLLLSAWLLLASAQELFSGALASVCAIASGSLVLFPVARRKSFRIDVTGIGQIRLVDTSPVAEARAPNPAAGSGEVVQLLRGSTFWSSMMVLRLRSCSGRVTVLVLLPDSMDRSAFHALSVAGRWIAARQSASGTGSSETFPESD